MCDLRACSKDRQLEVYPGPVPAAGKASWASQGLILVVALGIEPVSKRPAPLRPVYRPPGPPLPPPPERSQRQLTKWTASDHIEVSPPNLLYK